MLKIIEDNPFRFLGVYSNSSAKELVANVNRLKAYLKIGKNVAFPMDFINLLSPINRSMDKMEAMKSCINMPKDKLKYALFWFICATPIVEMALEYLQKGNTDKAHELFTKKEDYSSLLDQGVLAFILGDEAEAISCITKMIHTEDYLSSFMKSVCDKDSSMSEEEVAKLFIDTLLDEIPVAQLKMLFLDNGVSQEDDDYLSEKAVERPIASINSQIEQAKNVEKDDAIAQYNAGVKLMNGTKNDLATLRSLLGKTDVQYQMIADNLSNCILQCGINYYNNSEEDEYDEIEKASKLQNYALSIAVGKLTKDRCRENCNILNDKKQNLPPKEVKYYDKQIRSALTEYSTQPDEISYAIDLIKRCIPYLMSIKEILGIKNPYYLKISTFIVNAALHNVIEEFNNTMNSSDIKVSLNLDRVNAIERLMLMFNEAWQATLYMDKLDMEDDFRNGRYNENRKTLKDQVSELINVHQTVSLDMRSEKKIFDSCMTLKACQYYIKIFPGGKYLAQINAKIENLEFDACKTTQDCERFRNKYPNSKCPISIKWEDCYYNNCNTITSLRSYLRAYPKGRYVSRAYDRIDELSYKSCKSISDYKKYIQDFPNGKYRSQSNQYILEDQFWNECVAADKKEIYKDYLAKYPNGRHKEEAQKKANACYVATMVYGDYNHPQVMVLRRFRDVSLQKSKLGRTFIAFYYRNSPCWVECMRDKIWINNIIRFFLDKFIKLYNHANY
jgi:hypothetical protein